jgi:cysteine desulfuration protein SufE
MADTIDDELAEMADEFELLGDWEERYRHLIDLGRTLAPLTEDERSEPNRVRGCASQVWVVREPETAGRMAWRGDSDAHLVRGLIAVVLRLFNARTRTEILAFDIRAGLARLGLTEALSTQRSNGLMSMIDRIRRDASDATAQHA